jgi:hypothetical protein
MNVAGERHDLCFVNRPTDAVCQFWLVKRALAQSSDGIDTGKKKEGSEKYAGSYGREHLSLSGEAYWHIQECRLQNLIRHLPDRREHLLISMFEQNF